MTAARLKTANAKFKACSVTAPRQGRLPLIRRSNPTSCRAPLTLFKHKACIFWRISVYHLFTVARIWKTLQRRLHVFFPHKSWVLLWSLSWSLFSCNANLQSVFLSLHRTLRHFFFFTSTKKHDCLHVSGNQGSGSKSKIYLVVETKSLSHFNCLLKFLKFTWIYFKFSKLFLWCLATRWCLVFDDINTCFLLTKAKLTIAE